MCVWGGGTAGNRRSRSVYPSDVCLSSREGGEGGLAVSVYVSFERKLCGTFIQSLDSSLPVEREKNWVSQERGGEFTARRRSSLSSLKL